MKDLEVIQENMDLLTEPKQASVLWSVEGRKNNLVSAVASLKNSILSFSDFFSGVYYSFRS